MQEYKTARPASGAWKISQTKRRRSNPKVLLFMLAALLIAGGWIAYFFIFRNSDKEIITRRFEELTMLMNDSGEKKPLEQAMDSKKLASFIDTELHLDGEENYLNGTYPRDDIPRYYLSGKRLIRKLKIEINPGEITFPSGAEKSARVEFSLYLNAELNNGSVLNEARNGVAVMVPGESGKWVFRNVTLNQLIKK